MAPFRDVQTAPLGSYMDGVIEGDEFLLLHEGGALIRGVPQNMCSTLHPVLAGKLFCYTAGWEKDC